MARETGLKDKTVDSELIFCYAKCGDKYQGELELFLSNPNQADILATAEKCFDNSLFTVAKILFTKNQNHQRLAVCYVKLKDYKSAMESAQKTNIPKVWKQVCFACVRAKEFKVAAECGIKVIGHPDHLESLCEQYERFGYVNELISLMVHGQQEDRSKSNNISTELGILYAKY
jgi:clathrin heavy chain